MEKETFYREPMQPWPDLVPFVKNITLEKMRLEIFIYQAGEINNPPIIMIHGLGDEADTWRYVIGPLSQNYHVIALDLPGFGRSAKPKRDYTPKFLIDTILEVMSLMDIDQAILMGSSLGAMLSHAIAIKHPEKALGLILVGGTLLQNQSMKDKSLRLMSIPFVGEWLYTRLRKDPHAAFQSLANVYHRLDGLPQKDHDFLFTRVNRRVWSDDQRRAYFSTLRNLTPWIRTIQDQLPTMLSALNVPTLIIRGEFDTLFPSENARGVAQVQPSTTLITLEKSGHLPHQENPIKFLNAVTDWLNLIQ
jgi:pimeloyl-ACP methyl ester carboxylesterase